MVSAVKLVSNLPPRLKDITKKILVGPDGELRLQLGPKSQILLGKFDDLRTKLISVLTFLDDCRKKDGSPVDFETLDVSAPGAPIMTPANCKKRS
jgi:hypothetical protein